jgi:hypothetical protein
MPDWLQWFVKVKLLSHLVTAVRDLVNNGNVGWDCVLDDELRAVEETLEHLSVLQS